MLAPERNLPTTGVNIYDSRMGGGWRSKRMELLQERDMGVVGGVVWGFIRKLPFEGGKIEKSSVERKEDVLFSKRVRQWSLKQGENHLSPSGGKVSRVP